MSFARIELRVGSGRRPEIADASSFARLKLVLSSEHRLLYGFSVDYLLSVLLINHRP